MDKLKAFATLLLSAIGIFGANEYYKSRNMQQLLKWRGVKLASDDRAWKSMFFEHKDELEKMNIKDQKDLWTWCGEKFKGSNLNDENAFQEAKKYCSDNPISIMARIIREGEESKLVKDGQNIAFSINYLISGNKAEILKLIDYTEKPLGEVDLKEVGEKLSKWCENQKREKITSSQDLGKFGDFKKRCYDIGVRNFSGLLRKQGRTLITTTEKLKKRLIDDNLQYAPKLMEELGKIFNNKDKKSLIRSKMISSKNRDVREKGLGIVIEDNSDVNLKDFLNTPELVEEVAPFLYKSYCDSKWNKSLIQENKDLTEFEEVSFRCTEGNAS